MITAVTPTDTNGLFLATSAPLHLPGPIGKGRTNSLSGSVGSDGPLSSSYGKAPGSEREDSHQMTAVSGVYSFLRIDEIFNIACMLI